MNDVFPATTDRDLLAVRRLFEEYAASLTVLDTLASMHPAIALYESFGFLRTPAYHANLLPEVVSFRLTLPPGCSVSSLQP